jgi:hypothetical protein
VCLVALLTTLTLTTAAPVATAAPAEPTQAETSGEKPAAEATQTEKPADAAKTMVPTPRETRTTAAQRKRARAAAARQAERAAAARQAAQRAALRAARQAARLAASRQVVAQAQEKAMSEVGATQVRTRPRRTTTTTMIRVPRPAQPSPSAAPSSNGSQMTCVRSADGNSVTCTSGNSPSPSPSSPTGTVDTTGAPDPLTAAQAPDPAGEPAQGLTGGQLGNAVGQAEAEWKAVRPSADFSGLGISVGDLGGNALGSEGGGSITIDADAAGWGWDVSSPGEPAGRHMDLLSAVRHELGHFLGLDHSGGGVMAETLSPGESHGVDGSLFPPEPQPQADPETPAGDGGDGVTTHEGEEPADASSQSTGSTADAGS